MTFTKSVTLPVTPDEAFALITEPERLRRWLTVSAYVELRAGGDFRWTIGPGHHASGTVKEIEPGKRVVLGWGWDEDPDLPRDASTVTVTVTPASDGTEVTLTHEGLTEEQAASHAEGWTHFLARLEEAAASGDAGQDEWASVPEPLDLISCAEATLAVLQPVLRGLTTEDKVQQTPCADYDCHALAEHLFGSLTGLGGMAGIEISVPDGGSLEDKVSTMADRAITAWRKVDLDATVPGPAGEMPAVVGAAILSIEFLIHAWDFAQASGQQVKVSDEVVAFVRDWAEKIIPGARDRGAFGPEATAPEGATPLDRLAAFSGRTLVTAETA